MRPRKPVSRSPWRHPTGAAGPDSGLQVPVGNTIVTSFTHCLWRSPKRFGPLVTAVASPAIPAAQVWALHTWPLLVEARE